MIYDFAVRSYYSRISIILVIQSRSFPDRERESTNRIVNKKCMPSRSPHLLWAIAFRLKAFSMLGSLSPTYSLLLYFDDDMQYLRLPRAIRHHLLSTFFPHQNRFCATNHKGDEEVAIQVHISVLRFFPCRAKAEALFQACQVHADTNKPFDVWPNRPKIHGKILKRNCMRSPGKMKTRHFHSFWVCGFLWISTFSMVAAVEWQKMYKGFSQIKMKIHKFVGVEKGKFEMEKWPFTLSNDTHYRCQFTFQIMEFQTHIYQSICTIFQRASHVDSLNSFRQHINPTKTPTEYFNNVTNSKAENNRDIFNKFVHGGRWQQVSLSPFCNSVVIVVVVLFFMCNQYYTTPTIYSSCKAMARSLINSKHVIYRVVYT